MLKIIIDPGHGGRQNGAERRGIKEKDITLRIAQRVKGLLKDTDNFDIVLTRNSDVMMSLFDRVAKANSLHADLFICIHINAWFTGVPRGIKTYYCGDQNIWIADMFHRNLEDAYYFNKTKWSGIDKARFYTLRKTKMPAVFLEIGFLSNVIDRNWLTVNPDKIAAAIYFSILEWKNKVGNN